MMYKNLLQEKNRKLLEDKLESDNVPELIKRYFINIESSAGALLYWRVIKNLLQWAIDGKILKCKTIGDILPSDFCDIEAEDVKMYLTQKEQEGVSPTTLETRKNIFSSFWNYLARTSKCPVNINIIKDVRYKGIPSSNNLIRKMPSETQLKNMQEKIMKKKEKFIQVRNLAIMQILKETGLRESELAGLDLEDLLLTENDYSKIGETMPCIRVIGKGKYRQQEARSVYVTKTAIDIFNSWLEYRKQIESVDNAVFLNKNGKRFTEDNIKCMFKNYGGGITPHMMRHLAGTIMATKMNPVFAQQQLGHRRSETTNNIYVYGGYGLKDLLANM